MVTEASFFGRRAMKPPQSFAGRLDGMRLEKSSLRHRILARADEVIE
jgi:hypothetical protein